MNEMEAKDNDEHKWFPKRLYSPELFRLLACDVLCIPSPENILGIGVLPKQHLFIGNMWLGAKIAVKCNACISFLCISLFYLAIHDAIKI